MIVYCIRRLSDGLFSCGGRRPNFSKTGKFWKKKSHLSSHLNLIVGSRYKPYDACEIVGYELTETEIEVTSINDFLANKTQQNQEKEEKRQNRIRNENTNKRKKEYLKLKREFEP